MRSILAVTFLFAVQLAAEPVAVRYAEGSVHGYLSLSSADGKILASGDVTQVTHADKVILRLIFHFKDGSLDDETATFSQRGFFRLISDRHIQTGPAFSKPSDVFIDAVVGIVKVRYRDKGKQKEDAVRLDLPADLANGIIINVLKNISSGVKETRLSWLALTPKPRLIKLLVTPSGVTGFSIAGAAHQATRFQIKPEIGGIVGLIAPLVGKQPDNIYVWIAPGDAPAFVKSVGAQFLDGPPWTIELARPNW